MCVYARVPGPVEPAVPPTVSHQLAETSQNSLVGFSLLPCLPFQSQPRSRSQTPDTCCGCPNSNSRAVTPIKVSAFHPAQSHSSLLGLSSSGGCWLGWAWPGSVLGTGRGTVCLASLSLPPPRAVGGGRSCLPRVLGMNPGSWCRLGPRLPRAVTQKLCQDGWSQAGLMAKTM